MSRFSFLVVAVAIFVGLGMITAVDAQQTWPMYQANPAHTGYIPVTFGPEGFTFKWEIELWPGGYAINPVSAANGRVFATFSKPSIDHAFGINASNGSILWSKNFGAPHSVNPPAVSGNFVYIQVGKECSSCPLQPTLFALNPVTGAEIHSDTFGAQWEDYQAPTFYGGRVYINGGYYGGMYCFDFAEVPPMQWFLNLNQEDGWTPAVDGSFAYAYPGRKLSIVDVISGIEESIPLSGYRASVPVLGGQNDVILVNSDRLVSFNIGGRNIRYELSEGFHGQPNVRNGVIYAFNYDSVTEIDSLEARNQTTGALIWSWPAGVDTRLKDTMIVTDAHVLLHAADTAPFPDEHTTRAIDLTTHEEVWSYPVGGRLAFSETVLYIARDDGYLTALQSGPVQAPGQLQFTASAYSASEETGSIQVQVSRTAGDDGDVGVTISTADVTATAGDDYTAHSEVLTWADGSSTSQTVALTLLDDALEEQPETFTVNLSAPTGDAVLGTNNTATVTIIDDETCTLQVSPPTYTVSETGGTVDITVTRIGGTNAVVGVTISTADASATGGQDFVSHSEVLDWGVGDATSRTITITINDDTLEEGPEYFNVNLSNPTGPAYLGTSSSAYVTIVDDDLVEVSANETILGAQSNPAVSTNSSGNTVTVWQSYDEDGSLWDVYGRRFDSAGETTGPEFLVNQTTTANQMNPDVAVDNDGSFVAVWQSDNEDGFGAGIFGRCFSAAAVPEGNQFQINTTTALDQTVPSVAMDTNGNFLVVYQTSNNPGGTGEDLRARGYAANCTPLGSEFPVNSTTAADQVDPEVAANGSNAFVVVWQSYNQDGPANGIITRRFNGTGSPLNSETIVNVFTSGNQEAPSVDCAADGKCLVAWQDANNRDGDGYSIQARSLAATGAPTGADKRINTYYQSGQTQPTVAVSDDGSAVIAWESDGQDGSGAGVYCQFLSVDSTLEGNELAANLFTWSSQSDPAVARTDDFVIVTWTSGYQDGDSDGIFGRFFQDYAVLFADGFESGNTSAWN